MPAVGVVSVLGAERVVERQFGVRVAYAIRDVDPCSTEPARTRGDEQRAGRAGVAAAKVGKTRSDEIAPG